MTLAEILVSMGLLTMAVIFTLTILPGVASTAGDTQLSNQALCAAQEKLDEILRLNTRVSTVPTTDVPPNMTVATRTVTGAADPGAPGVAANPDLWIVTVTVAWKDGTRNRSVTLRSAVSP